MNNTEKLLAADSLIKQADLQSMLAGAGDYAGDLYNKAQPYLDKGLSKVKEYAGKGMEAVRPYVDQAAGFINENYHPLDWKDSWKGGLAGAGIGAGLGFLRNKMRSDEEEGENRLGDMATYAALMGIPMAALPAISGHLGGFSAGRKHKDLMQGEGGINAALNPNSGLDFRLSEEQYNQLSDTEKEQYAAARSGGVQRDAARQRPSTGVGSSVLDLLGYGDKPSAPGVRDVRGEIDSDMQSGELGKREAGIMQNKGLMDLIKQLRNIPGSNTLRPRQQANEYDTALKRDMATDNRR